VNALVIEDLVRRYGERVAVDHLDLTVAPGAVLGLVGPNGAGKTTTLRTVAGILPITDGTVIIDGVNLAQQPVEARRRTAYVPDDPHLFDALTVWEHLEFIASVYGLQAWEADGRALLAWFELADRADTTVQGLSRGMRQKVALVMAFLHRPALMMLDEPMTGLDPLGMRRLREKVRQERETGMAFVISSHQLDLVEDLSTHLLILVLGKAVSSGTLEDVKELARPGENLEDLFLRLTGAVG
jgi:ABC-2 type transport system ATP-binding protein